MGNDYLVFSGVLVVDILGGNMSIEKMMLSGHQGYNALNEKKNQGCFAWWNKQFGKVVLYETWRNKQGEIKPAYGKRKSKSGACQKNVNFIPELAEEIIEIIRLVSGVKGEQRLTAVVPAALSADHDIKRTIKDIGV